MAKKTKDSAREGSAEGAPARGASATKELEGGLAAAAEAMRREAGRKGREEDRTTLEVPREDAQAAAKPPAIGELLVARGLITRHQLFNALNEVYRTGGTLEDALVALGMIDREALEREKQS
jgi:hypothetical protein